MKRRFGGAWRRRRVSWIMPVNTITRSSMTICLRLLLRWSRLCGVNLKEGTMLDELKEEAIVNKVGGRFKLSTLIQKRMVALNTGARPLVDVRGGDKMTIVIQEILQDKIYLDATGQIQTRAADEAARRAMLSDIASASGGMDE